MTLYEKIKAIYPELADSEFNSITGTIQLRNDSDGRGDYIASGNTQHLLGQQMHNLHKDKNDYNKYHNR